MPLLIVGGLGLLAGAGGTLAVTNSAKTLGTLALLGGAGYLAYKKGWI
ncbi:MAG: hypothetical protein MI745_06690 [Pseudomonadales bacterium]|nr:hypothetical protein [Pseudomonadales bacterium]